MFETILYSVANRICRIHLNRPEKRNAFNAKLVEELFNAFTDAESDKDVKVIILTGEGIVFSAGADLGYLQSLQNNSYEENLADSSALMQLYKTIYMLSKPVIARINGHAIAGGCGLATVCDFSFSVPEAQFGYTEVKIGFIPAIVMVFLLRRVNERNAKELLLTGKLVSAQEALQLGLINAVVEKDQLDEYITKFCNDLIENASTLSLASTKKMIARIPELSLDDALDFAAEINARARTTADCKYGIQSFLNKEKPKW